MPKHSRSVRVQRAKRRHRPKTWCQVYGLAHPETGAIYYVGQTRLTPEERFQFHMRDIRKRVDNGLSLSKTQSWIWHLVSDGCPPAVKVIDKEGVWDVSEAVWIERLRVRGEPLLNVLSVVPDCGNEPMGASMRRKPKPAQFGPRDLYAAMKGAGAPCRQKTQECLHTGDCGLCGAWTGEACLAPKFDGATAESSRGA